MRFQGSGLLAAVGHLLRFRFGPQKIGQILLASALSIFYLAGLVFTLNTPNDTMKMILNVTFPFYAVAAVFAVVNLGFLKRYALVCSFLWGVVWVVLSLGTFGSLSETLIFLRAISIEAAFIMAGLFIAASYLSWMEEDGHA